MGEDLLRPSRDERKREADAHVARMIEHLPEWVRHDIGGEDWHDPWGTNIGLMFSICDVLAVHDEAVPSELQYRPAMGLDSIGEDSYWDAAFNCWLGDGTTNADELRDMLHHMSVLDDELRLLDLDY